MSSFGKKLWALPLMVCSILIAACLFGLAGCGGPETYKITFDANGGYFGTATTDTTYTKSDAGKDDVLADILKSANQEVKKATTTTKAYAFDGWYTAKTGGTKVTKVSDLVGSDKKEATVYAHWTETALTLNVASETELKNAITVQASKILVTGDFGLTEAVTIDYDCEIDLGGKTISAIEGFNISASATNTAPKVTIKNGEIVATKYVAWVKDHNGALNLEGVKASTSDYQWTIFVAGDVNDPDKYHPELILGNGTQIINTYEKAIDYVVNSAVVLFDGAKATMESGSKADYLGGELRTTDCSAVQVDHATFNMKNGASIYSNALGVFALRTADVTIDGKIYSYKRSVTTSEYAGNGNVKLTIDANADITATNGVGVFVVNNDTVVINGGTIYGATALYVKSGNTTVNAGCFKTWYSGAEYAYKQYGCHPTGDAIVIEACGYASGAPNVTISDEVTYDVNKEGSITKTEVRYIQYNESALGKVTVGGTELKPEQK